MGRRILNPYQWRRHNNLHRDLAISSTVAGQAAVKTANANDGRTAFNTRQSAVKRIYVEPILRAQ